MNKKTLIAISLVLIIGIGLFWFFNQRRIDFTEELRLSLEEVDNEILENSNFKNDINDFYFNRDYLELWFFNGKLSSLGEEMISQISDSKYDGLQPNDYNLIKILELSSNPGEEDVKFNKLTKDQKVKIELLLTDSFFKLSHDLVNGKVDPSTLDPNWKFDLKKTNVNYLSLLEEVTDGSSVNKVFSNLYKDFELYKNGREALKSLYEIQMNDTLNWEFENVAEAIKVGEKNKAIPVLRQRLIFWGFISPYDLKDPTLFDSTMFRGLQEYQNSNGMNPDGVIGARVAESLNNSPQNLIDIASINMERLRWMPKIEWDQEMVLVNIANYQLDYLKKSDTVFTAKVIVGKEYNESPTFTAPMTYIVFSPYWNIPESITKEEIIPSIKKNKSYLTEKKMEIIAGSGEVVKMNTINWNAEIEEFPYRIRQKPGGDNSLGLVKFMFPNEYNIYIHDTPARNLFSLESRALSHGCIRIQNPEQFAKILLKEKSWDDEKIKEAMNLKEEMVVDLDRKIPVVLIYMTFWADENGKANFRSDVYDRDSALLSALRNTTGKLRSSLD
ncbi:L,D-transpeptidase family protein [Belliella sp. R4-6]|uniref:L,D-transpeptidase family protein n=1 Tax=Belliella alkalica TaxID=1730871 RepID=A0ABS9VCQ7_9BACT|nr:L,D-transpeptidase family protein [Belliella alkalica]MCH7414228.1 L,D-transpeptidase family protein [Belliella alkalica]